MALRHATPRRSPPPAVHDSPSCAIGLLTTQIAQRRVPQMLRWRTPAWSHYVKLLSVEDKAARQFYESAALRGGWSVRQLDRQISSQFYQK